MAVIFVGRESAKSYAWTKKGFLQQHREDRTQVCLKITDIDNEVDVDIRDDEGHSIRKERQQKIVSVSTWKVRPTYVPEKVNDATPSPSQDNPEEDYPGSERTFLETKQERLDAQKICRHFPSLTLSTSSSCRVEWNSVLSA